MMLKNATKAASSLKNKYSSLASSRRARWTKNTTTESDKSEGENVPKSETDDDTPIGDQLDSLFGKHESESDVKEESEETGEENGEKDIEGVVVAKTKPDPVHESDPDEEISAMAQMSKEPNDVEMSESVHKEGDDKETELTLDSSDVPKTAQLGSKSAADEIQEKVTKIQEANSIDSVKDTSGQSDKADSKVSEDTVESGEVRKSASNDDVIEDETVTKATECENFDSSVDDSIDGDKSYNTESDSDLAALRSFSLAVNEATNVESSIVSSKDIRDDGAQRTSEDVAKEPLNNNSIVKDHVQGNDATESASGKKEVGSMSNSSENIAQSPRTSQDLDTSCHDNEGIPPTVTGTPKKNPFLENLVESCKAKLGVNAEELVSRSYVYGASSLQFQTT